MEKNGGRPKKETNGFQKIKTNGFQKEETKTKPNVNENDNVNVNVNVNDNVLGFYDADVAKIDQLMIECLNSTNINNTKECVEYLEHLPVEVIEYALRKTARIGLPNWGYAKSILDTYVNKNINTLDKARADDLNHKGKKDNNSAWEEFMKDE